MLLQTSFTNHSTSPFFVSSNIANAKKIIILVPSGRNLPLGLWNANVAIKHGLKSGSVLEYVAECHERDMAVIITNPYKTTDENETSLKSEESKEVSNQNETTTTASSSMCGETHMENMWDTFIETSNAKRVFFIAHGHGGVLVKHLLSARGEGILKRNGNVALIESSHRIEETDSETVKNILSTRTIVWEASDLPLQSQLHGDAPHRTGCICLSAGPPLSRYNSSRYNSEEKHTISIVQDAVFRFFAIRNSVTYAAREQPPIPSFSRKFQLFSFLSSKKRMNGTKTSSSTSLKYRERHCGLCKFQFTLFDRRHHCRMCHRAVCNACSPDRLFLPGAPTAQRVCMLCSKAVSTGTHNTIIMPSEGDKEDDNNSSLQPSSKLRVEDFDLLKVVGKGAFGMFS